MFIVDPEGKIAKTFIGVKPGTSPTPCRSSVPSGQPQAVTWKVLSRASAARKPTANA
jgi:hypothetical protein